MDALELQNEQRAKLDSGGEARTGNNKAALAASNGGRTFCFGGMLSTMHSGTSLILIGYLKPMRKAASKGNFRDPCSWGPPHSLLAVL